MPGTRLHGQRVRGASALLVSSHGIHDLPPAGAAMGLPLRALADLRLPPGTGDKRVLRACAARLGLARAAARVKRAIQFGSRLGQQANRRDFGSGRKANAVSGGSVRLAALRRETGGEAAMATAAAGPCGQALSS